MAAARGRAELRGNRARRARGGVARRAQAARDRRRAAHRREIPRLFEKLSAVPGIEQIGVSTNGTLLAQKLPGGGTLASALWGRGVRALNVSLDTLDRADYAAVTGRDFLPRVIAASTRRGTRASSPSG